MYGSVSVYKYLLAYTLSFETCIIVTTDNYIEHVFFSFILPVVGKHIIIYVEYGSPWDFVFFDYGEFEHPHCQGEWESSPFKMVGTMHRIIGPKHGNGSQES